MPLSMINAGEQNYIYKITGKDKVREHLAKLGFVEGSEITVICKNSTNMILNIKDSRIAIDMAMANRILVTGGIQ